MYWFIIKNKPQNIQNSKLLSRTLFKIFIWYKTAKVELKSNKKVLNKAKPKGKITFNAKRKHES